MRKGKVKTGELVEDVGYIVSTVLADFAALLRQTEARPLTSNEIEE